MKKNIAISAIILASVACFAGGVVEVDRSGTQTCGATETGPVFTNTFGGSFGYQLLQVDVWGWTTIQTNIDAEIYVKAIEQGSGRTNILATLTNTSASVEATGTNYATGAVLSPTSTTIPAIFTSSTTIWLQGAVTSQTFSASIKRLQFMRQ